ncbi:hypothetical protein CQA53_09470 [Helicobacter didelphidarum]|uniref:Laccase domain-containing protein n=1 Tax=Helicobacter didelphidarum TaxID=2040648 RepID=A0A3D8IBV3_9HELI|nr:polyphenol oxidase family protein [Helicobacter didelphidarum]RDU62234.1 hypothetical protein CQA53_09470 [Helicobacter didelphidarum]
MNQHLSIHDLLVEKYAGLHAILTNRNGGISNTPFDTLNLAYHVNDSKEHVIFNRTQIMRQYYPEKSLLYLNQIHSNHIITLYKRNTEKLQIQNISHHNSLKIALYTYHAKDSICLKEYTIQVPHAKQSNHQDTNLQEICLGDADGIICDDSDFVAMIMVADCNPILLYCPKKKVFALLHAGRKGVCQSILTHAVILLRRDYMVDVADLRIFIGASIRKCCYEVGFDIAQNITEQFGNKHIYQVDTKYMLDMISILCEEMQKIGIQESHITIPNLCSSCNKEYFSYRRENTTGRFGIFATLQ